MTIVVLFDPSKMLKITQKYISPPEKMPAKKLQNCIAFAIISFSHRVNKQRAIDSILQSRLYNLPHSDQDQMFCTFFKFDFRDNFEIFEH
jgi:hypothetical protein